MDEMKRSMILKISITRRMKSWTKLQLSPKPRERERVRQGLNLGKAVSFSSVRIGMACVVNGSRRIARGDICIRFWEPLL